MPQPDIDNAVNFALAQSGKPYRAFGDRFGPDYYDCSGLVIRSLYEAGIPLPPGISVENEYGNTVSLYNWAKDVGGLVSVEKAVATRGAILIKGRWYGNGPLGHTSFSLGDGREMAAHGRRTGIGVSNLYGGRNYQDGFLIPGVNYHQEPPVDPAVLEALAKLAKWKEEVSAHPLHAGMPANGNITIMNTLLVRRVLLDPKAPMNIYGKQSIGAVNHLKRLHKIPNRDGRVFGSEAAKALLTPPG